MMHPWKPTLLMLALILIIIPTTSHARVAVGQIQISSSMGIAVPVGSLRDLQSAGFTGGFSIDYMAANRIALGADLNGVHFTGSTRTEDNGFFELMTVAHRFSLAEYGLHVRWYLTESQYPNPFLEIGAGVVTLYSTNVWHDDYWDRDYRSETVEMVPSRHFGAGLDLRISNLASGVVRVAYYYQDSGGGLPVTQFWTARFALAFQFRPI